VTIWKEIREPIRLDGETFTCDGLLDYSSEQAADPGVHPWRKEVLSFIALFLDKENPAILQLSSGTTGDPRSHSLNRDAMCNSARRTLDFFKLKEGDTALLCLPVQYIAGKMMVVRALLGGLDLILQEPASRPLKDLERNVDFAAMVPLQLEESLRYGDPIIRINRLLMGGGELHPATRARLASMNTPEMYETFGMTETYTHFALKRISGPEPESAFRLLEGVRIGRDGRNCLEVDVPGVTSGKLLTNDLVEIHEDGSGFKWLGRYDNLINSGGIKIIPELLEEQVRECLGLECLVLPEADRRLGNRLVLMVEFQGEEPPVNTWTKQLRNRLSAYEMPKRIVTVESLPRNPSLKPDRTSARGMLL